MHTEELTTLKDNLKRARKLLATSPRDLREEREKEVQRLEKAMKRTESLVNKDRREKIEQEALGKVAAEEKAKRKEGKGAWYLKQCEYYAFLSSIHLFLALPLSYEMYADGWYDCSGQERNATSC